MKKIIIISVICLLIFTAAFSSTTQSKDLYLHISKAADIRKTDSQDTEHEVNSDSFDETGHGDPNAPVQVESWRTTKFLENVSSLGGDWYYYSTGKFAFGWDYDDFSNTWSFNEFDPENIETGLYDSGTMETLRTNGEAGGDYYFIGNHTRFHIATNFHPLVKFEAPEYLFNGVSKIKVKQIQIGWNSAQYAIIPGGEQKTLIDHPCSPGNYSRNQYALYAVIEMPEQWWDLEKGGYSGTVVLTLLNN